MTLTDLEHTARATAGGRIHVTKRDGTREPYDADRINRAIERATAGLPDPISIVTQVASELAITLFDGITTEQLDEAAIAVAVQNVKDDPDFDVVASRLLRKVIHKRVLGGYDTDHELALLHQARFPGYVREGVELGLLDTRLATRFDLDALAAALDHRHDERLRYIGTVTMRNRYMLTGPDGRPLEVPQWFWMRVAMGLSLTEDDPTAAAIRFYDAIARLDYLPAGSTLVNAGTSYPQLSNCFVMQMDDDIEHIATSIRNVMWLTKGTGGIGLSVTKLRAEGSRIRSNNTASTGPIPFMHTIDSTLRAVSRGGKKFGALCFYIENWHLDFPQFLDLRQNSGDPYRRTRTANTAVWISDEFMKRVAADDDWYLFDPADTPDLVELTGAAFSARYAHYVGEARSGRLQRHRRIRAREQWTAMLVTLQSTSHPWLTWKDSVNTRALNDNTGTIHLSNLCTEITLPQDRDTIAVCNLASVNLASHLVPTAGDGARGLTIDWARLERTTRLAVRQLDNLVDITLSSVPESERANEANRAVGLGVMGFTDVTEQLGLAYDSPEAAELADRLLEHISWHAIDASADLARERGAYPAFAGSGWSHGVVPVDTLDRLEADRGVPVTVDRTTRLDWDALRAKVAGGMRNATLMAIAPTASIGLVAGTTPGLDPQFSQIFSRATSSGKFLEVNRNLVRDLQARGLWEQVRDDLLAAQGDLAAVPGVPDGLVAAYQTSFQVSPYAFVEVAARAQKWVDQAISRNIYLASRDVGEMSDLYRAAWERGVKTTYYLHMKPRHTAEQSTVRVNKAESREAGSGRTAPRVGFGRVASSPAPLSDPSSRRSGDAQRGTVENGDAAPATTTPPISPPTVSAPTARRGFGFGSALATPAPVVEPSAAPSSAVGAELDVVDGVSCPVDPMERLQCDSCQ
ncbi:ribonucleoside-diphosphate reductase subunit alpha [Actinotalea sp. Marseille-Q4924]|uniref:ribonucleoside-diphosphate reductase subunit alpha n=1 Tax=Actinotalea sp. Marseille-Q4924 TaxID=2866571 RepID=UPI001CE3FBEA|nr:ribonucleoside-diphosphate reductase subunit alpha [Actinotalea sp. Marseille-Q4924]